MCKYPRKSKKGRSEIQTKQCDSLGEGRMGKKTPETPCTTDRSWAHAQGTVAVGIYSQWGCIHVLWWHRKYSWLQVFSSHLSFFRKRFWQSPTFKRSQCKGSPSIKYCDLLQEKRWYRWPAAVILSFFHVIVVEHMCSESLGAKAHRAIAWILLGCTGSHAWCLILVLGHAVQKEERECVSQQPPCFWQNAVAAVFVKELNLAAGYDITWWSFGGDRQTRCLSLTDFIFFFKERVVLIMSVTAAHTSVSHPLLWKVKWKLLAEETFC